MHDGLVNRVQDQGDDENRADILPRRAQQLAPVARIRENGPQEGGWPLRASRNPALIAKKMATAGWMMKRKGIGPPGRPRRLSRPRQKASSIEGSPVPAGPS